MNSKIKNIEKNFYQATCNEPFYLENDFNESIYRLTNAIDYLFIKELHPFNKNIANRQDELRHSYRAILLKIHESINNTNDALNKASLKKSLKDIIDQIDDSINFNHIRNSYDRVKTNNMSLELKDDVVIFKHNLKRNINADIYSRWIDSQKPFLSFKTEESLHSKNSFNDLMNKNYSKFWDNKKNKTRNKYILHLIADNCYLRMKDELLDIKEDIQFKDFSLDEFRRVFSLIQATGILKMNQSIFKIFKNKNENNEYDVSVDMNYTDFINSIKDYVNIDFNKIESIVNLLIYDYEFQKEKISIYKPLFKARDRIFYSTMLVYYSLPQDKLFYKLLKERKNRKQISYISMKREELMIENIVKFINSASNLEVKSNYLYYKNGKPKAEYDLLIVDKEKKIVSVVELKWYFKNDNEFDIINIDEKLVDSIDIRLKRFETFNNNKKEILKDAFGINDGNLYESFTCIVTENHSGTANMEDEIAVFDRFAFYYALDSVNYDLSELYKIIKKDKYLPIPPVEIKDFIIDYHGQKYSVPLIVYRM